MKKISVRGVLSLCLVLFCGITSFSLKGLPQREVVPQPQRGVLTVWHVDTFEGGSGSRFDWLRRQSVLFQKKHPASPVCVSRYSYEQVRDLLQQGERFDVISFSAGTGAEVLPYLKEYTGAVNVREDLLGACYVGDKIMALPYAYGGYCLSAFSDEASLPLKETLFTQYAEQGKKGEKFSLGFGSASFQLPWMALALGTTKTPQHALSVCPNRLTQYEAYESFLNRDTFRVLLGTQRDLVRFDHRLQQGRLSPVTCEYLTEFTDLIQCIGCAQSENAPLAQKFMEFLTSTAIQKNLKSLKLFPAAEVQLFDAGLLKDAEKAFSSTRFRVVNVFSSPEILHQAASAAERAVRSGEKDALKNYLV